MLISLRSRIVFFSSGENFTYFFKNHLIFEHLSFTESSIIVVAVGCIPDSSTTHQNLTKMLSGSGKIEAHFYLQQGGKIFCLSVCRINHETNLTDVCKTGVYGWECDTEESLIFYRRSGLQICSLTL